MGFRLGTVDGRAVLVHEAGVYDLERLSGGRLGPDAREAIAEADILHEVAAGLDGVAPDRAVDAVRFGPPMPNPANVFGIGVNYREHGAEMAHDLPSAPLVFAKFTGCLTGPTDPIVIASDTTDYEVELVLVIGREAKDVPVDAAWDVVAGVTVGQDVSDRGLQNAGERPQFSLGKSHDTYGPTGPWIVSTDLLDDRDALPISCEVNGEVRQSSTTAQLIFNVPTLVSYLSSMLTLRPGDLVFTGTPSGVGHPTKNYLRPGDTVRSVIGGIGEMINPCR